MSSKQNKFSDAVGEVHNQNICIASREIFLHSYIDNNDEDAGIEYRMSNGFLKNLRILENISSEPIVIHQHTEGGNWHEGMMIYDSISLSQCPIIIITHGTAFSMGSIIPQAADLRITMPNCWWMLHQGSDSLNGPVRRIRSEYDCLDLIDKQMMDIYASVFKMEGKTDLQIRNFIKKKFDQKEDWYLLSKEAVEYGLCDAVYGSGKYDTIESLKSHVR